MERKTEASGMLFHSLNRAFHNALQAEMAAAGLGDFGSPPILLFLLERHCGGKPPAQRELAEQLHISPAAVAMSLKSLERGGYIEKRMDPEDQRCKRVSITEKGSQALATCFQVSARVEERMFDGFTPEECRQLADYHWKMLRNLRGGDRPETLFQLERKDPPCSKN